MNKQIFIISMIAITLIAIGAQQVKGISEDQSFICKQTNHLGNQLDEELTCTLVNDDNVLSEVGIDTLYDQFKHDLDTFSPKYLNEID